MEMEKEVEAVTTQWQKIEAYLDTHAGGWQDRLNPGATEEEIVQAETALRGIRFPNDFRASLKRHNGQASYDVLLGTMGPLLSTEDIISEWSVWTELWDAGTFADRDGESYSSPGVKDGWWNPRWIPVSTNGAGDNECLDMDPAEGGTVGQVMEMCHEDSGRPVYAPSFLAWLTACASNLEDGTLVYDEDTGFTRKDEAMEGVTEEAMEEVMEEAMEEAMEQAKSIPCHPSNEVVWRRLEQQVARK